MAKHPTRIGYQKWMPHNLEIIKKKSLMYLGGVKKRELVSMLKGVAQNIVSYIDGQAEIPEYSGNLRDATGVGVYVDGALSAYVPTKSATRLQKSGFHYRNEYRIDGSDYLKQALADAASDFSVGIWIVLFSAVPYAYFLNEPDLVENLRGKVKGNYFGEISDKFINEITLGFKQLKPKYIL